MKLNTKTFTKKINIKNSTKQRKRYVYECVLSDAVLFFFLRTFGCCACRPLRALREYQTKRYYFLDCYQYKNYKIFI